MTVSVVQSVNGPCSAYFNVWASGAVDLQKYHFSTLAIELHILPGQEKLECSGLETSNMEWLELFKDLVAKPWSGVFFLAMFGVFGACSNLLQSNSLRIVAE
ncbi:hypothetical protein TNCV_5032341 [Trichonephila clavipes]|nr:hypothetical protein TNCV_5032341 [Trichonephila clavipes]